MNCRSKAYSALAAAVALACGAVEAQDETEIEERIEAADERADELRQDVAVTRDGEAQQARETEDDAQEAAQREQAEQQSEERQARDAQRDLEERQAGEERREDEQDEDYAARRQELLRDADRALDELREQNESAARLINEAYGHAVFDTTKGGFLLTGAGGTGVARAHEAAETTFMRLGQAGIGLGVGLENYKLVLLFEDQQTYRNFVAGQWDGNLSAQAAAGSEGVAAEEQFIGGVRAYRVTDGGLMAQVDVSGARFWPVDRLNHAAELELARAGGAAPARTAAVDIGQSRPERLDELAAERGDLDVFVEAVKAAGLADALTGDTPYTVFAPTDQAFEQMSGMTREELLAPENREQLTRLLRAHIVADDLDQAMARNIPEARTIDGGTVSIDASDDRLTVGDATVVAADIRRGNLRIYAVDRVLAETAPTQVATAEDVQDDAEEPQQQLQ